MWLKAIDNLKAELELALSKLSQQDKASSKPQDKPAGGPSLFDLIGASEEEPETPEEEEDGLEEEPAMEPKKPVPPAKPDPKDKGPKEKVPPT